MGKQEGKTVWSLEDNLKKAELAIKDKTLVLLKEELIRTERKPDWVWREAKRRLKQLGATEDLNADQQALASSYWALAKLKRDYLEEFNKKIKPEGKEVEKKKLRLVLPGGTSIIQHLYGPDIFGAQSIQTVIEFDEDVLERRHLNSFINDLFDQFLSLEASESKYFMPKMIQILEEKFAIRRKTCANCEFQEGRIISSALKECCVCPAILEGLNEPLPIPIGTAIHTDCGYWMLKKEEAGGCPLDPR